MPKKIVDGGYVMMISPDGDGITEEEYNEILGIIRNAPSAPEGYEYRLREDLAWELCETAEPEPCEAYSEDALAGMTNAELADILAGLGISASMTKANMVRLILAAQSA